MLAAENTRYPQTFNKFFTIDRTYIVRWDITRSINIDFAAINKSWVDEDSGALDKAQKKQMWDNFWKGGRTIQYQQTANFTYTVPTNKIPIIDWTTLGWVMVPPISGQVHPHWLLSSGNCYTEYTEKRCVGRFEFFATIRKVAITA